jgi:hypothetical protein
MIIRILTFISNHLNVEVSAYLALNTISGNQIVTFNLFHSPLILNFNLNNIPILLVSPVPMTEQGRVLRETLKQYIVEAMLREVIRVRIRERLLKMN